MAGVLARRTLAAVVSFAVGCASLSGCGQRAGGFPDQDGGAALDDATAPDGRVPHEDGAAADASHGVSPDSGLTFGDGSASDATAGLDVEPSAVQTITVSAGQSMPTVLYKATLSGVPANVGWGIDRGNIGSIGAGPSSSATFVPTGTTGGLVTVVATAGSQSVRRQVFVKLTAQQNGVNAGSAVEQNQVASNPGQLSAGGGVGGVGGEGLGGPVMDPTTLGALQNPSGTAQSQNLSLLYPYDKTVWPRGMLAPLLMWTWNANDADAIQIQLSTTSGSFSWTGTFARPSVLSLTKGPFIRHPIPQDVWTMATDTAGGPTPAGTADPLTMSLTVAKAGQGYGPIKQTWGVAPGRLTGTVYYNSYGTQLVKNWSTRDAVGNTIGAAILGIRSGDTSPTLVVGQNSSDNSGCRVCHIVSSRGKWMITQSEQGTPFDGQSYLYDLTQPNVQGSVVSMQQEGVFAWAAMVSDGTYALTNAVNPSSSNTPITNSSNGTATSSFWQFGARPTTGTLLGLPQGLAAGYPSYSPDDKFVAYVDVTGKTQDVQGPLDVAAYDAASHAFSNVRTLHSPAAGQRIGYPVFLPDDSGVVFETQVRSAKAGSTSDSVSDTVVVTRNGARSELWWTTAGATPTSFVLANLNGQGYLPHGPNNHGVAGATDPESAYDETGQDDTTLNYEPTVLPVAAGGYAWVVFTSRRIYGNQLTSVPWLSWPPDYNTTDLGQATVKKLWVAAIDLNAAPGTDPSHPAFYLPAQEILAGNSRGFWVLDPCKPDGQTCSSGDQCCNGYCEPSPDGGGLVCGNVTPGCSGVSDKCATPTDCCDSTNLCVNGYCTPQVSR
jgi:hypothetical protein